MASEYPTGNRCQVCGANLDCVSIDVPATCGDCADRQCFEGFQESLPKRSAEDLVQIASRDPKADLGPRAYGTDRERYIAAACDELLRRLKGPRGLTFGTCEECDRVLVAQMGMGVEGAGNWDGVTKRCEFCKAVDYFERVRQADAIADKLEASVVAGWADHEVADLGSELRKVLDEHPFPEGHKQ